MKSTPNRTWPLAVAAVLVLSAAMSVGGASDEKPSSPRPQVVVTMDLMGALTNSLAGKAAQVKFREELTKAQERVEEKTGLLRRLEAELSAPDGLEPEQMESKRKQFERERIELKILVQNTQDALDKRQAKLMAGLTLDLKAVIEQVAKEKGYDFVLGSTLPGVIYVTGLNDITGEVLARFDSQWLEKVSPPEN